MIADALAAAPPEGSVIVAYYELTQANTTHTLVSLTTGSETGATLLAILSAGDCEALYVGRSVVTGEGSTSSGSIRTTVGSVEDCALSGFLLAGLGGIEIEVYIRTRPKGGTFGPPVSLGTYPRQVWLSASGAQESWSGRAESVAPDTSVRLVTPAGTVAGVSQDAEHWDSYFALSMADPNGLYRGWNAPVLRSAGGRVLCQESPEPGAAWIADGWGGLPGTIRWLRAMGVE
jgi:hypothetical protein